MTSPRIAVAFAFLTLFVTHQAVCEESETATQLEIADAEVAFVEAREYDNSQWNRIRNSILYWIAPNYLKTVWPFDGYDIETVRNLACESGSRRAELALGSKLTFVRAWGDHPLKMPVDGVEVDFKSSPESGPRLKHLCTWLPEHENSVHTSITQIILQYDALNPPRNGQWDLVHDEDVAMILQKLDDAIPILRGEVPHSDSASNPYRSWKQAESNALLSWSALKAENIDRGHNGIRELSANDGIWRYHLTQDQDLNWGYYLTIEDAEIQNDKQDWKSPQSKFDWSDPPKLTTNVEAILWALPIAQRNLDDDWYLVTDKGFADLDPLRRFEQQLKRKGTIDTDLFVSAQK